MNKTKLNIGSGGRPLGGINSEWLDLDCRDNIAKRDGGNYTPDLISNADKISLADNTIVEALAHSILEHVGKRDYHRHLVEWCRVIKPGGKLIVSVPDMYLVSKHLIKFVDTKQAGAVRSTINLIYGEQDYIENTHLWGWTESTLISALRLAGFTGRIKRLKSDRYPAELLIEAVK